ncbi:DUF4900 domain-containing protein [Thermus scotoductus]|uniref:DUF4900 domain-containing protein n=1 Tax=Thermus scotoductus TaxID=37636 RepID=A0A430USP9_THESC|nr:DUF4900 domain-containing protein [Thermus scotoductus]RTI11517.1 DUF4900 domain-containing protein [Thermus scotoductus]
MERKGIALVLALATVLVVSGLGSLLFLRTLGEIRHSGQDQAIVQALMLARGAANAGGTFLATKAREMVDSLVRQTASTTHCWAYGGGDCTGLPDPIGLASALASLAQSLQSQVDGAICNQNLSPRDLSARVSLRVHFTPRACGQDLPPSVRLPPGRFVEGSPRLGTGSGASQTYALPFVMVAEASFGPYRRNLVLQGEYRFTVGRSSFARYALFTHIHTLPNRTEVWFTDRTLFDGPVHTNAHFRFFRRPWFGGEVTSAGCTSPGDTGCTGQTNPGAHFYGAGFVGVNAMRPNPGQPSVSNRYGTHAPQFTAGVDWQATFIPLPQNSQDQERAARQGGLYYDDDVQGVLLYRKCFDGNQEVHCPVTLPPGSTLVKYQYIEVTLCQNPRCTQTRTEVYRYGRDGWLYQQQGGGFVPVVRNGAQVRFNGVIFATGRIHSLQGPQRTNARDPATAPPALAEFAQITVAARATIRITGDLKYENPPCQGVPTRNPDGSVTPARCENLSAENVLGVYSQEGDVLISQNAPRDLQLHGSLMSSRGVVQVENYDSIPEKGSVFLLGGIIQRFYGAFGTFDPNTGQNGTGYGRAFTYDRRFLQGLAPPFFPTTGQDRVQSVSVFSYGQREQVY